MTQSASSIPRKAISINSPTARRLGSLLRCIGPADIAPVVAGALVAPKEVPTELGFKIGTYVQKILQKLGRSKYESTDATSTGAGIPFTGSQATKKVLLQEATSKALDKIYSDPGGYPSSYDTVCADTLSDELQTLLKRISYSSFFDSKKHAFVLLPQLKVLPEYIDTIFKTKFPNQQGLTFPFPAYTQTLNHGLHPESLEDLMDFFKSPDQLSYLYYSPEPRGNDPEELEQIVDQIIKINAQRRQEKAPPFYFVAEDVYRIGIEPEKPPLFLTMLQKKDPLNYRDYLLTGLSSSKAGGPKNNPNKFGVAIVPKQTLSSFNPSIPFSQQTSQLLPPSLASQIADQANIDSPPNVSSESISIFNDVLETITRHNQESGGSPNFRANSILFQETLAEEYALMQQEHTHLPKTFPMTFVHTDDPKSGFCFFSPNFKEIPDLKILPDLYTDSDFVTIALLIYQFEHDKPASVFVPSSQTDPNKVHLRASFYQRDPNSFQDQEKIKTLAKNLIRVLYSKDFFEFCKDFLHQYQSAKAIAEKSGSDVYEVILGTYLSYLNLKKTAKL